MVHVKEYPSQEEIRKHFLYKDDGTLWWRIKDKGRKSLFRPVGSLEKSGHLTVVFKAQSYKVHRLIYIYHYGTVDAPCIDHIDGNPQNNRIENLRSATYTVNACNQKIKRKNNTTGARGVHWHKNYSKWRVAINQNKKTIHIGYFEDFEEAVTAFDKYVIANLDEHATTNRPREFYAD